MSYADQNTQHFLHAIQSAIQGLSTRDGIKSIEDYIKVLELGKDILEKNLAVAYRIKLACLPYKPPLSLDNNGIMLPKDNG